jgi:anti-sigma B factor antagonist
MKLSIAPCQGTTEGNSVRVALAGQVTQRDLNPLEDPLMALLGPGGYSKLIRLDLSEADYLDSSGVGWLLTCHKRIKQAGGRLLIEKPHPMVVNVFKVLKLEKVLELADGGAASAANPGATA